MRKFYARTLCANFNIKFKAKKKGQKQVLKITPAI